MTLLVSAISVAPAMAQFDAGVGEDGLGKVSDTFISLTNVCADTFGGFGYCITTLMGVIGDIWNDLLIIICQPNFLELIGCIYPSFEQAMIGGLTGMLFGSIMGFMIGLPFCCIGSIPGLITIGCVGLNIGCLAGALAPLPQVHMETAPSAQQGGNIWW